MKISVINDNEFHDYCYEMYVVNDRIYYIGEDVNVYSMDLEGGDRQRVLGKERGYVAITEDYIIYNDYINEEENIHVGQLIELMKMVDPNADKIIDGMEEGKEQLATLLEEKGWDMEIEGIYDIDEEEVQEEAPVCEVIVDEAETEEKMPSSELEDQQSLFDTEN